MEKIGASCLFLLTTNNISKVGNSLAGNFIRFRLPYPEKEEIVKFLNQILFKENITKKSNTFIENIIEYNKCNLSSIMLNLELNLNNTSYKHDNLYEKNKFIKKLQEPNPENIIFFRNELYNLSSKNICVSNILNDLIFHYLKGDILSHDKKIKITEKYSNLQKNINHSYKDIVIYESILINLFNIIHN